MLPHSAIDGDLTDIYLNENLLNNITLNNIISKVQFPGLNQEIFDQGMRK